MVPVFTAHTRFSAAQENIPDLDGLFPRVFAALLQD